MNALAARIARLIEAQGPISVAQFMAMANSAYYANRDPFGAHGDFITAPEVSQMFGELIGLWIVQCWQDQGQPSPARLVELGPGRGTLMADALRAARLAPEFLKTIEVVLVETSPALREMQREKLSECGVKVRWQDSFDDTLADRPLFLMANEFFDALPVRQFVKTEKGWNERMVTADQSDTLSFAIAPIASTMSVSSARGDAKPGAIYEMSPASSAIVEHIGEAIARNGGAALIVDYGYGSEAGHGETLQAVGKHGYKSVLENSGDVDLSAHVDFASLADAARAGGALTFGPVNQGDLLNRLGIGARAKKLAGKNPAEAGALAAAIERLTSPKQMGTLFKALAITPKHTATPPGF
jgi:NADH dehydrogenase [ubiquinone] 1 alpha subcomplex assembly factor 7